MRALAFILLTLSGTVRATLHAPLPPAPAEADYVDRHLDAARAARGLSRAPEADRRTLLRRLHFSLTGLPPSPEEVEAFAADPDPTAYARAVDRLLASPYFGERWARHWLDVVRFAESDGFETNQPRPNAWPYRDYVIRAFNEDLPYDRFIHEQLAGDQLGVDAATGFIVGGPWDRVKSPDPVLTANQRADELQDMVATTGGAFLGLTAACARCHDHKSDPILQTDYFALAACFAGVRHGEREARPPDWPEREAQAAARRVELAAAAQALDAFAPVAGRARVVLVDDADPAPRAMALVPGRPPAPHAPGKRRGEAEDPGAADRLPNLGGAYHWWEGPHDRFVFAWAPALEGRWRIWLSWGCGWHTHARDARYVLDADGDPATAEDQVELAVIDQRLFADGSGEPFPNRPLWSGFRSAGEHTLTPASRVLLRAGSEARPVTADVLAFEEALADLPAAAQPRLRGAVTRGANVERFPAQPARLVRFSVDATSGAEPCLDELEVFTAGESPRNVALAGAGARATASSEYANNPFHKIPHLHDGRYGNEHSWISRSRAGEWVQIEFAREETVDRVVWSRDRAPRPRYADRVATGYRIALSRDGEHWTEVAGGHDRLPYAGEGQTPAVRFHPETDAAQAEALAAAQARHDALAAQVQEITAWPKVYAGVLGQPEPTHRFHRGDPMAPREIIAPGGIAALDGFALPPDAPDAQRRRALAEWITGPAAPLTARVMVNRLWQHHFGIGLVDTPSDFGEQGGPPSHPALLDALAADLVVGGWRLKRLHRTLLLSAAFRQSSAAVTAALAIDADNRLLWRYAPRRMEAEALRDALLAVSGRLDLRPGGPGFDLFAPNTNYVKVYETKERFAPEDFRRMIYQHKPRVELDTLFGAFDCPDAGQATPRRTASTTPLQALGLFNSAFTLELAEALAARLAEEAGPAPADRVERAFALVFQRRPEPAETEAAAALVAEHGWPALTRALFNANEFLQVR